MDRMRESKAVLQAEVDSWEDEREQLQTEVARLEQLLQVADSHMETEIGRLHQELGMAQQQALQEELVAQENKVRRIKI